MSFTSWQLMQVLFSDVSELVTNLDMRAERDVIYPIIFEGYNPRRIQAQGTCQDLA